MVNKIIYKHDGVEVKVFDETYDPDPNYVLTLDNAKKILAIHQRLRLVLKRQTLTITESNRTISKKYIFVPDMME